LIRPNTRFHTGVIHDISFPSRCGLALCQHVQRERLHAERFELVVTGVASGEGQ
jgi:hypothetical protein